jgi:serine/threonine-protein kinase
MNACAHCGAPFNPVVRGQTLCDRCQGLAHPEPLSPLHEAEVAGYKLVHELGAGRFAHTWLAEDERGQAVVLKLLRRYAPDPNSVQRFLAEAQRLADLPDLDHPNLARPITAGVHLVSAFVLVYQSGGELTLADELRQRGRVLPGRALEFCAQLCEGLAAAHRAGVLHLDLKPANVGVTKAADGTEQAVVLDLVTSHLLADAHVPDAGPLPISTAAYRSPEGAAGKPPDARSDLYSVGVLLFQLISGRLPMMGATADELLKAHRDQPPLRLRDVGRKVHADLEGIIARLLAKNPAQRPESGDEAAVMMRAIIPVADTAPMEDGPEGVEDPVPVVESPRPDPEIAPAPPQMLPRVDPALERAMLGHVPPQPAEKAPGIPHWAAYVPSTRWMRVAGLAAVASITVVVMLLSRKPMPAVPGSSPAVAASSPVSAPASPSLDTNPSPSAVTPPAPSKRVISAAVAEAMKREPAQDPTTLGQPEAPPPPAAPRKAAPAVSPYARNFDRAQKALWTDRPASAESVLHDLLKKKHLSRRDRARAAKMMGDAESKKGNKATAARWYKKSLKLSDDPDDRARIEKLLR